MQIVKVRRVGNSNVISLPKELEAAGYVPGASVAVERMESGELLVVPEQRLRERVRQISREVVEENSRLLAMLAAHDRD
jgi:antitoxin component of MazEF toxin-antitoxin module